MSNAAKTKDELKQYLTFILDGEEYGVPILKVNGIQGWEKTTPIPNSPEFVKGIINLRGEIVPIIDLRKRFGLEHLEYNQHTVVIVVRVEYESKNKTVGLVVDAVADVYNIEPDAIHSTPEFGDKINNNFIRGLGMINEKMVILLDIDNLVDWKKVAAGEKNEQTIIKTPQLSEAAA